MNDYPEPGTCPECGSDEGRVIDSRHHDVEIRRTRRCTCGCRWASSERTTHIVRRSGTEWPAVDSAPVPA